MGAYGSRIAAEEVHIDQCTTVSGGTFSKSYVTYTIKIVRPEAEGGVSTVDRRYSEFENIFGALARRYGASGGFVPPMFKDSSMTSVDKQKRMRGLAIAMRAVHSNAFMRFDPLFIAFCSPECPGKKADEAFTAAEKSGETRWDEFLPTLPGDLDDLSEDDLEKKCGALAEEANKVGKAVDALLKAFAATSAALAAMAKACAELEAASGAWATAEATGCPMLNELPASLATGAAPPVHHAPSSVAAAGAALHAASTASATQSGNSIKCLQVRARSHKNAQEAKRQQQHCSIAPRRGDGAVVSRARFLPAVFLTTCTMVC